MPRFSVLVALKGTTNDFDKLYSYAVPPEFESRNLEGCRVYVPFGRGDRKREGIIFSVQKEACDNLKNIDRVIDDAPVLSREMLQLAAFMRETLFCTYYDALSVMLPAGLGFKERDSYSVNPDFLCIEALSDTERQIYEHLSISGEKTAESIKSVFGVTSQTLELMVQREALIQTVDIKRQMGDATQKWLRFCDEQTALKLTPRQAEVFELLKNVGCAAVKEVMYYTGVSISVIDALVKKGVLEYFEKPIYRMPYSANTKPTKEEIVLTDEQQFALDGLTEKYTAEKAEVALLYGVTGSGKTQVFLALADRVIKEQRGVIVMVPEIALTPQLVSIFTRRYGNKVALFHSAMSMGQRMDEWKRIRDGNALIAIGTRSAVFAPFKDLGLIIIDEEQEHTYKSEKSPRFHTRDIAKYRTNYHKGLLCLASATPSLESYTAAKMGKYSLFTLKSRYGNAVLPTAVTVDMKKELMRGNTGILSELLYENIKAAISNKKQVILLLNRRGHNTYVSCAECGNVASCPNCSISLTYHSANGRLMCHYCGYSEQVQGNCSVCGSEHVKFMGLGTQKAQQELEALFPKSRILRLDADTTVSRDSYSTYLNAFLKGEYDILLGTQMVAKGLDFPNVTLVGVLGADGAMYSEDFRGFERTFSLLTQVVGRAGRGDDMGCAVIQTFNPENNIIELACKQDYDSFYNDEIAVRKLMVYPPFCDICTLLVQSALREDAQAAANIIFAKIKQLLQNEFSAIKVIILGPTAASIARVNNKYRFRLIIKCKNNREFRQMLRLALKEKIPREVSVAVDINPEIVV